MRIVSLEHRKETTPIAAAAISNNRHSPQRMPGDSIRSVGPGRRFMMNIADRKIAAVELPGIPSDRAGISAPAEQALLATSAAMIPSSEPWPNFSFAWRSAWQDRRKTSKRQTRRCPG